MAEAKKREKNFERSYSDKTGVIEISHNDDTILAVSIEDKPEVAAVGDVPAQPASKGINADVLLKAAMRYVTDILVGVGNAVLKAEGATVEMAQEKMAETLKALQDGTFKFRAASGQGGLSLEDEKAIIADALVALGKATDKADGLAKLEIVYARTKTNKKGFVVRPDYNAIKAVPQIKAALAVAEKSENKLDDILSFDTPATA
jgi:hypothetical protein